jgi:hypothetical protein
MYNIEPQSLTNVAAIDEEDSRQEECGTDNDTRARHLYH